MQSTTEQQPFLNIPETVSEEAQEFLRTLTDPASTPPFPDPEDFEGWKTLQALVETGAIQAPWRQGRDLEEMILYGDSSGGGLAAAVILKMRDQGLGMPAAAVLVSPWLDVTRSGDTEFTLAHAEPSYLYEKHSKKAA